MNVIKIKLNENIEGQANSYIIASSDGQGNLVSIFVYGTKVNVPDYIIKGGEILKVITDPLGSVRFIIRTTDGQIFQRMEYDSFGNVIFDSNEGFTPFGFAGGLYDPDTGLVRFGARDYDPEIGRWTSKDPILFYGGDLNLYKYSLNDPINFYDQDGCVIVAVALGAFFGSAIGGIWYSISTRVEEWNWEGFLGAMAGGAAAGGLGTMSPAIASSLYIKKLLAKEGIDFLIGGIAYGIDALIDPCMDFSFWGAFKSSVAGVIGGYTGRKFFPTKGMSNFNQFGWPRNIKRVLQKPGPNTYSIVGSTGVAMGVGIGFYELF